MKYLTPLCAVICLGSAFGSGASLADEPGRVRRVLYNFDGDSCLSTKANSKGPIPVGVDDVKRLIEEVAYDGSRVDTVLVCINAQVMYYPTKVGTMRGTHSTRVIAGDHVRPIVTVGRMRLCSIQRVNHDRILDLAQGPRDQLEDILPPSAH